MNRVIDQGRDELISCDICIKEVPLSEAKNDEGADYVMHYFGLECYSRWTHQDDAEDGPER